MDDIKWLLEVKGKAQAMQQGQQQLAHQAENTNRQNQDLTPTRGAGQHQVFQQRSAQGQPLPYYQQSTSQQQQQQQQQHQQHQGQDAPLSQQSSAAAAPVLNVDPDSEAHRILLSIAPQIKMQLEMLYEALAKDDLEKAKALRDRVLDGWGA